MATRPNMKAAASQDSPNTMLIAAISGGVLLVILIVWLAFHYFGGNVRHDVAHGALPPDEVYMQQMAKKCGGDFNKLSPADQKQVVKVAGGGGPSELYVLAHSQ
ncbi:MAG TPA: hypothetical protein VFW40_03265 [Capsulimonadaceae bacterium]|nr:hypothetical protein [Capsulimonadaceae bacterium]